MGRGFARIHGPIRYPRKSASQSSVAAVGCVRVFVVQVSWPLIYFVAYNRQDTGTRFVLQRWAMRRALLLCVFVLPLGLWAAAGAPAPLYMITYDHGGLILWGTDHFAERLRNAISWLDRYPSFKIGLDNEAYLYDYLAEKRPELLKELRGCLRKYAGRFGIGTCTYGQPLSQFINEESNIRQISYAIRADREHFGYTPSIYFMSEHAMHSQIPQILAGFGFKGAIMRTHFMMYGYNPTFNEPIGRWVGLDGSRIAAIPTYVGEGAEFGKTPIDNWILTRYPGPECSTTLEEFRDRFKHIQPLVATRADDSGLRREELVRQYEGRPEFKWLLVDELLNLFPEPAADLKTLPDDFKVRMPWGYCGNEIWNRSRQAEVRVLTAERLAAIGLANGGEDHEKKLQTAWKNLLVGQHHDVQIVGLLPDAREFLEESDKASTAVEDAALQFAAARMKTGGFAQVTVFNPLSWARRQWIEVDLSFHVKGEAKSLAVSQGGRVVPSVVLRANRFSDGSFLDARLAFAADVPGLTLAAYSVGSMPESSSRDWPRINVDPAALRITTPYLDVQLDPNGGIASARDRKSGAQVFAAGRRSSFFAGTINGKESESRGRWTVETPGKPAPRAVAKEYGFIADIPYTLQLTFSADSPQIDCRAEFRFDGQRIGQVSDQQRDAVSAFVHEKKLRFKLFPAVGEKAVGVRDLPFAIAETTDRYVEGNYWTGLSDGKSGLAIFNRGTMGSVREADGGLSVPLTFAMYYIWGTRMLTGDYAYEFAFCPFLGDWRSNDLHRRALEYNFPAPFLKGTPGAGPLSDELRLLDIVSENVILSSLYSEGGRIYVRMYESQGRNGTVRVQGARLTEVDLLGNGSRAVTGLLDFRPWQIRTFRVGPGK